MAGAQRGYQSEVRTPQLRTHAIPFHITDSSGTPVITGEVGSESISSITDNGTGDYTINLRTPAARAIIGTFAPDVANLQVQVVSRTASAIRVKFTNNSGAAVDTGFGGCLWVNDDIVLRG